MPPNSNPISPPTSGEEFDPFENFYQAFLSGALFRASRALDEMEIVWDEQPEVYSLRRTLAAQKEQSLLNGKTPSL